MKITIKITDGKTWDEETPLEFDIEEARRLYHELAKVFVLHIPAPRLAPFDDQYNPIECGDGDSLPYPVTGSEVK